MTNFKCCSNCAKFQPCTKTSKFVWYNDIMYCNEWEEKK